MNEKPTPKNTTDSTKHTTHSTKTSPWSRRPPKQISAHTIQKKIERQHKTMREKKTRKTCTVAAQAAENRVRLGVG